MIEAGNLAVSTKEFTTQNDMGGYPVGTKGYVVSVLSVEADETYALFFPDGAKRMYWVRADSLEVVGEQDSPV